MPKKNKEKLKKIILESRKDLKKALKRLNDTNDRIISPKQIRKSQA